MPLIHGGQRTSSMKRIDGASRAAAENAPLTLHDSKLR